MTTETEKSTSNHFKRYDFLDIIKSISILLVLMWHTQPIRIENITNQSSLFLKIINKFLWVFYYEISLIAVPSFFIVSIFLFFKKKYPSQKKYLQKRVGRLLKIFLLWSGVQFCMFYFFRFLQMPQEFRLWPFDESLWLLFKMGGPPLPSIKGSSFSVEDSVFYFLYDLIIITFISNLLLQLKWSKLFSKYIKYILGIIFCGSLLGFEIVSWFDYAIPYHSSYNFFIYIPISYFLALSTSDKYLKKHCKTQWILAFFILFIALVIKNQLLGVYGVYETSSLYARTSIVLGSILLFVLSLKMEKTIFFKKNKRIFVFLSRYSLGIFAIHKYWNYIILIFENKYLSLKPITFIIFDIQAFLNFFIVLFLTCTTCILLDKSTIFSDYIK